MAFLTLNIQGDTYMIGNRAKMAGQTAGVSAIRDAWYRDRLLSEGGFSDESNLHSPGGGGENNLDTDHLFGSVNNPDSYNNIILKSFDKDKNETARLEIVGAKIDLTSENTIVKTPLVKIAGTVKEFIQSSDYQIFITGDLVRDSKAYPIEALYRLKNILRTADMIQISNVKCQAFDIDQVVLVSAKFPDNKYVNVQAFSLQFLSDFDYSFLTETLY